MNAKLKYATILSFAIAGSASAEGDFALTGDNYEKANHPHVRRGARTEHFRFRSEHG